MSTYTTLKIKPETAGKFRSFSKKTGIHQSELIDLMVTFFLLNKISPKEDLGPNMRTLETTIKKRIGSVIAILRAIEKSQTKPTFTMLQLLFHEKENKPAPRMEKTSSIKSNSQFDKNITTSSQQSLIDDLNLILRNIRVSKTSFGSSYFRLNLPSGEINRLKSIYNINN